MDPAAQGLAFAFEGDKYQDRLLTLLRRARNSMLGCCRAPAGAQGGISCKGWKEEVEPLLKDIIAVVGPGDPTS